MQIWHSWYKCMKGCCERDITRPENCFYINQQSKMLLAITSLVNHGPKFNPLVIKVKFNICNLISHGDMRKLLCLIYFGYKWNLQQSACIIVTHSTVPVVIIHDYKRIMMF